MSLRRALRGLALLAACVLATAAAAQEMRIPPADEAAQDPSWIAFRNRLLNALQKHDSAFLLGITDRDVRNTTSGARGIAEFRKQWDLASGTSPVWQALASALFLGGAYVHPKQGPRELCAPYVLAKWPGEVDPFTHGAIVVDDAELKSEPSSSSATLQHLSYNVVAVADWDVADREAGTPQRWVKVSLGTHEGYVPAEHIRSPVELAACFVKGPGGWRMVAFAPAGGD